MSDKPISGNKIHQSMIIPNENKIGKIVSRNLKTIEINSDDIIRSRSMASAATDCDSEPENGSPGGSPKVVKSFRKSFEDAESDTTSTFVTGDSASLVEVTLDSSDEENPSVYAGLRRRSIDSGERDLEAVNAADSPGIDRKDVYCGSALFQDLSSCKGPGGCVLTWEPLIKALKAAVIGGCSSALTFGLRPFIEATLFSAGTLVLPPVVASLGGAVGSIVVVGLVHTLVGKIISGLANSAMQGSGFKPNGEGLSALINELGTIDLPVMAGFTAAYAARGALVKSDNIWTTALSMSIATVAGGAASGAITNAVQQALAKYTERYQEVPSQDLSGKKLDFLLNALEDVYSNDECQKFYHDVAGKTIGGALGILAAKLSAGLDVNPALGGGAAMFIFLLGWFGGVHLGEFAGFLKDKLD